MAKSSTIWNIEYKVPVRLELRKAKKTRTAETQKCLENEVMGTWRRVLLPRSSGPDPVCRTSSH